MRPVCGQPELTLATRMQRSDIAARVREPGDGLPTEPEARAHLLTAFRGRWNAVDDEALPVPQRIYDKQKAAITKKAAAD